MSNEDWSGLFWTEATVQLKKKKAAPKPKAEGPYPFWLNDDFLPGLDAARRNEGVRTLTNDDWKTLHALVKYKPDSVSLVWDTECYHDLWSIGWRVRKAGRHTELVGKSDRMVMTPEHNGIDRAKAQWIMANIPVMGFNSERYDATMFALAMHGLDNSALKIASDELIGLGKYHMDVLRQYKCHRAKFFDHVDLQDLPAGMHSLKTYAARLGAPTLQDLPFPPHIVLGPDRRDIVVHYMENDGTLTQWLADSLESQVQLRRDMSDQYGLDLRNYSDPKIAETVLRVEYERKTGASTFKPKIPTGTLYQYKVPEYMEFKTPMLQEVLEELRNTWFEVGKTGHIELPDSLNGKQLAIGQSTYTLGIGGLHSTESNRCVRPGPNQRLRDADVASYYPAIILNQGLYPKHLGPAFLDVYRTIVDTRLAAKARGDKTTANSLKIVINSSFGKFGNKHSVLYAPDFVMQITLTGQLSLFMLIEALEEAGMSVMSANTDGIVTLCEDWQEPIRDEIYAWWQKTCGFDLEYVDYACLASASVNSYYAVSIEKGGKLKCKRKGLYAGEDISVTPAANVCADAVEQYLLTGKPIEDHIRGETNMLKFVTVRNASKGGVWGDWYLGKTCRWYYSNAADAQRIVSAKDGSTIAGSNGCRPCPVVQPGAPLPDDLCIATYIEMAYSILEDIGVRPKSTTRRIESDYEELSYEF